MDYKALHNRLRKIEAVTGAATVDNAERERRERDSLIGAYTQSPAGAEMDRHLAGMARGFVVALSYEQHPEAYHDADQHFARPRFDSGLCDAGEYCGALVGNPAKPWCSCGKTSEEIGADFMAAQEEAYQLALVWLAEGAPGAPDWYRLTLRERQV